MTKINLHFTGSMFGLGAAVDDIDSLQAINRHKKRKDGKSFIVLLSRLEDLWEYVKFDAKLEDFLSKFWAGELTVILPCVELPHLCLDGFVGFRVPSDRHLRGLLQNGAVVSTSVNCSGESAMQDYEQIVDRCGDWFDEDWVPAGVMKAKGIPSTVVKIDEGRLLCVREGAVDIGLVQEVWDAIR